MRKLIRAVIWRWLFLTFLVAGIFGTGMFVGRRNEVNKKQAPNNGQKNNPISVSPSQKETVLKDVTFPENFFFGTAYSVFQVAGVSHNSDWYHFVKNKVPIDKTLMYEYKDSWEVFKEDYRLAGQIGIQVHRLSLEWSLIEPEEGKWDYKHINKLKELIAYGRSQGVETMICMMHFPLPQWFADKGGWANPDAPKIYGRYAEFLARNLGVPMKIKWWLTFNEPQYMLSVPYGKGSWPPFKGINSWTDQEAIHFFTMVATNLFDSHRVAYRKIHEVMDKEKHPTMVSFASAPSAFYPSDPNSKADLLAVNILSFLQTYLTDTGIGMLDRDFIGLNYYGRHILKAGVSYNPMAEQPVWIEWSKNTDLAQDGRPTEFYPQGMYDLIMKFKSYGLPIVITENGIDNNDDKWREEFIILHLKAIADAIHDGANVIGYQYWALADTWEPGDQNLAFSSMGLITADPKAPKGSPPRVYKKVQPSAWSYSQVIKTHRIPKELLEKYQRFMTHPQNQLVLKYNSKVEDDLCDSESKDFNKGIVTLTFDDGWREIYENAIPLLDQANVKSTQYIFTQGIEQNDGHYMNRENVLAMEKAGHEIGSHAVEHKKFTEMNEVEIMRQLSQSRDKLHQMGVSSVGTFAYPYGEYTDESIELTKKSPYTAVRTIIPGMNGRKTDQFFLYAYQVENWMDFESYLKDLADQAIAEKKWLILVFHQVAKPDFQFYTSPENLNSLINYLIEKEVPIMTVRDVAKRCYAK